jgi:small neutral amino acid transporter SnatA (MarC family)
MGFRAFFEVWFNAFLGLFAILNPLGNLGLFIEATAALPRKDRFRVFNTSVLVAFVTLLVLTFTGKWIMVYVFKIGIDEFKIAAHLLTVIGVERILTHLQVEPGHGLDKAWRCRVPLAVRFCGRSP